MNYVISEVFEDADTSKDMEILKGEGPSILSVLGFSEEAEDNAAFEVLFKCEDGRIFSILGSS